MNHLQNAWRALRARPGLSSTVIASLAVGIGANALLFAVVDAAILRPFPFAEPDRLVGIGMAAPKLNRPLGFFEVFSGPEAEDLRRGATTLTHVAAFDLNNEPVLVGDSPERVFTAFVWDDLFATLGVTPELGRGFSAEELRTSAPVAVVSDAFWRSQLSSAPDVIGRSIRVGGAPRAIVGVMPARTRVYDTDLWLPMPQAAGSMPRNRRQLNVLARLAPGATVEDASAELSRLASAIDATHRPAYPEYEGMTLAARPWTEIQVWGFGRVTWIAFGAAGLLLLLVTTNLASLLLARAAGRRREMAVRAALGAERRQLAKQLIGETLLQTALGATMGLFLAWVGVRMLPAMLPPSLLPGDIALTVSARIVAFAAILAVSSAVLVGLWPALQLSRSRPAEALNDESGRAVGAASTRRAHRLVVGFEVAMTTMVAGAAALLTVNTSRLLEVDRGFDSSDMLAMRITLPLTRYDGQTSLAFFDALLERVRTLPGVADATASNQPPPGVFSRSAFVIEDATAAGSVLPSAFYTTAGARYRETLGLRIVRGRWFDERASITDPREIVINETAAARYWPNEDPIGKRIRIQGAASDASPTEVVGVVADVRNLGLAAPAVPEMIGSVRQIPDRRRTQLYLVVRGRDGASETARGGVTALLPDVRAIVRGLDPEQPVYAISTLDEQYQGGVATRAAATGLLTAFSLLALGLAALGIFGVLAHAVHTRGKEIGLRIALGASRSRVLRLVIGQAMGPVVVGLIAGFGALVAGQQVIGAWLYGVRPEATPLVVVGLAVLTIALVASAVPAFRASRLSPSDALRGNQ